MYELSANIELLYPEAGETAVERVRAAAHDGFQLVEMWRWRNKDLPALRKTLATTATRLHAMCVEPMGHLVDPSTHAEFLRGVQDSVEVAETLECTILYLIAGAELPGGQRDRQRAAIVDALRRAADLLADRDVVLLLENLNAREFHGTFLDSTRETLGIVREVDSPAIGMLYDAYHSLVMGENPVDELTGAIDTVKHIQIADVPGKGEPGSGGVDWRQLLSDLHGLGYAGAIGLEYVPTMDTARSILGIREILAGI